MTHHLEDRSPDTAVPNAAEPYTAIASFYDRIMAHVDYDRWATYLGEILDRSGVRSQEVLELGCGTGNLARRLSPLVHGRILATDVSQPMLDIASRKLRRVHNVSLAVLDFREPLPDRKFDVVILAYDGINYLLEKTEVAALIDRVSDALNPNGLFLFDQSTPANSLNNLAYFDDAWNSAGRGYTRKSEYDADRRLHITRIQLRNDKIQSEEVHFQRAYDLQEMELIVKLSSLRLVGCFDAFSFVPATSESERVQWVLAKHQPTEVFE